MIKTVCLECRVMTDRGEGDEVDYMINMQIDKEKEVSDELIKSSAQSQFLKGFFKEESNLIGVSKSNGRLIVYNPEHVASVRINNVYIKED